MNDDLLHAAFELAINAVGAAGHADAKHRLQLRFTQDDFGTIAEAYLAACHLHDLSYSVAENNRDGRLTDAEALAQLHERSPGFAERTYSRALSQGWFESR